MRSDPVGAIRRQAAARHDAVNVRVLLQRLSPRVQDAEESNLGTEVFWIGRHFQ